MTTALPDLLADGAAEMRSWLRALHQMPELGYEEHKSAAFVAARLGEMGLEPVTGIGGTGVVAVLKGQGLAPPIGLRADMDALPIEEASGLDWASRVPGVMHACGHDGHMAMLLGAARYLTDRQLTKAPPPGDVVFLFQPAEETGAGAAAMIRDGLFDRFDIPAIYGLHNWPGLEFGRFLACDGAQMAAVDRFDITLTGTGCHAAMPHLGRDALLGASQLHQLLQGIVARNADPLDSAVVSVTQIHGGEAYNVLPETVVMRGCTRSLSAEMRDLIEARMRGISAGLAASLDLKITLDYHRGYPVTQNSAQEAGLARETARRVLGPASVDPAPKPSLASEDFAYFLENRPGCYGFLGAGPGAALHSPRYRFNEDLLPVGAAWWVGLAQRVALV
ncbi:M20 aminoacylase family protein [Paracoccus sp. IB05]|uniref:M20 aminoacylase family protein n=1 Tax=Paracoccus sp. IB05 TaxID=2779367 RepID=UPI001E300FF5|nr:M20 aminoacylase family protein [Paracoccus sp. IB05]